MSSLPIYADIILTFVGIGIAIDNAMVCCAFYANKKLRTMTNHFVISLAISDFLVGSILAPMMAWNKNSSALGPLIAFTLIGSLSNICGCTYDRFVAIHHPLRYHAILTKSRLYKILFLIWIIPLVVALIPQLWLSFGGKLGLSQKSIILTNRVFVGCMAFGVMAACIVLSGIYIGIFRVARRHFEAISYLSNYTQPTQQQEESNGRRMPARRLRRFSLKSLVKDVKATKLFAFIAATFVLCWLPLIIINMGDSIGYQDKIPMTFVFIALFTIFGNSLVNPIIYALFQQSFRETIVSWFQCKSKKARANEFYSVANGGGKSLELKQKHGVSENKNAKKSTYEVPLRVEESSQDSPSIIETKTENDEKTNVSEEVIQNGAVLQKVRF